MEPGIDIRRRSDGSIDIEHYKAIADAERKAAIRHCVVAVRSAVSQAFKTLASIRLGVRQILRTAR